MNNKSMIAINNPGKIVQAKMMDMLEYAYDSAISGLPGEKNVYELANDYLSKTKNTDEAINNLINMQITKAAMTGFVSGLGGMITLPITIPANIACVILFQVRMIATIAVIRGYDLKSDQVRTVVYTTLVGNTLVDIVKGTGIQVGNKLAIQVIKKIPTSVLKKINQRVGFKLVTKFGEKGVVNLAKLVPVVGGIVGASVDTASTLSIARLAKKTFTENGIHIGNGEYMILSSKYDE